MAVTIYRSDDFGAPVLDHTVAGTILDVLKGCLVNGYGAKAAAGWTLAVEDLPNRQAIFRPDPTLGTGMYYYVQDGRYQVTDALDGSLGYYYVLGCHTYTDINTLSGVFPRAGSAVDSYMPNNLGVAAQYRNAWIVVADATSCWVLTADYGSTNNSSMTYTKALFIGDLNPIAGGTLSARGCVLGDSGGTGSRGFPSSGYIAHSIVGGVQGVRGVLWDIGGGNGTPLYTSNAQYYPSEVTAKFDVENIYVYEDANDPYSGLAPPGHQVSGTAWTVKGLKSTRHYPGVNGAPASGTTVISGDGRTYLFFALSAYITGNERAFALDITGAW